MAIIAAESVIAMQNNLLSISESRDASRERLSRKSAITLQIVARLGPKRRLVVAMVSICVMCSASCGAPTTAMRSPSGDTLKVVMLDETLNATAMLPGGERLRSRGVVLSYLANSSSSSDPNRDQHAAIAIALPEAAKRGDTLIVIERIVPILAQWTGLVHGSRIGVRVLRTGGWRYIDP
jgi:hypothetical protein